MNGEPGRPNGSDGAARPDITGLAARPGWSLGTDGTRGALGTDDRGSGETRRPRWTGWPLVEYFELRLAPLCVE